MSSPISNTSGAPCSMIEAGVRRRGGRKRADAGCLPCTVCPRGTAPTAVSRSARENAAARPEI
eukprot:scaffold9268_cov125-Isochrysis_galbana.AAC.1